MEFGNLPFTIETIGMRLQPDIIWRLPNPDGRQIALTFDDGPNLGSTYEILDVLGHYNVNATFFVNGENLQIHQQIAKTVVSHGHELASHGWIHKSSIRMPRHKFKYDLLRLDDFAYKAGIQMSKLFRPPYGIMPRSNFLEARELGYQVVMGDIYPRDAQGKSTKFIVNNVLNRVVPGSILILHDGIPFSQLRRYAYNTVEALKVIIPTLLIHGYSFADSSAFSN
jgi:peptidoglycan-N-acetylglucosamine deacetylase